MPEKFGNLALAVGRRLGHGIFCAIHLGSGNEALEPREGDDVLLKISGNLGGDGRPSSGDGEEVVLGDRAFTAAALERGFERVLRGCARGVLHVGR
jgi:hypothetical protein